MDAVQWTAVMYFLDAAKDSLDKAYKHARKLNAEQAEYRASEAVNALMFALIAFRATIVDLGSEASEGEWHDPHW